MTSAASLRILGGMGRAANLIVLGCWLIFILYWTISAFWSKRIAERQSFASTLAHRLPIGLGFWLMVFPRFRAPLNVHVLPRMDGTMAVGAGLCVVGLLFTLWARWTLAGNWSSNVTFKQDHELIRTGPYRYVRHPIYTGLLIMSLGASVEIAQLHCFLGILLIAAGFGIKLSQEERLLLRHFPDQYPAYQKEVKALVPWII